jgi:hypothetical protein
MINKLGIADTSFDRALEDEQREEASGSRKTLYLTDELSSAAAASKEPNKRERDRERERESGACL